MTFYPGAVYATGGQCHCLVLLQAVRAKPAAMAEGGKRDRKPRAELQTACEHLWAHAGAAEVALQLLQALMQAEAVLHGEVQPLGGGAPACASAARAAAAAAATTAAPQAKWPKAAVQPLSELNDMAEHDDMAELDEVSDIGEVPGDYSHVFSSPLGSPSASLGPSASAIRAGGPATTPLLGTARVEQAGATPIGAHSSARALAPPSRTSALRPLCLRPQGPPPQLPPLPFSPTSSFSPTSFLIMDGVQGR